MKLLTHLLLLTVFSFCGRNTAQTDLLEKGVYKESIEFALASGLLPSIYAKEGCSCIFVAELSDNVCRGRLNFGATKIAADFEVIREKNLRVVKGFLKPLFQQKFRAPTFEATFISKELGCKLTKKEIAK